MVTSWPFWLAQTSFSTAWVTPIVPLFDFTPATIAVAVGALSATWASWV